MIFLDDVLKKDEITENLRYFANHWEFFCNSVEHPTVYTTIMTPHCLVKEILDELKTNGTDNTATLKYFFEQNEFFLKEKKLFTENLFPLWILLHEKLLEKEKQIGIIKTLAEKLDIGFSSKEYNKFLFDSLKSIIKEKQKKFDSVKVLAESIIFQFIFEHYSITTIKEIVKNIFSYYTLDDYGQDKKQFYTKYPLKTKIENNDYEKYVEKACNEIDGLNLDSRLERLYDLLTSELQSYYFIFYLEGLCFDNELNYGDIKFYNPQKNPVLKSKNEFDNDIFSDANYEIGMNVMVLQKGKDINSAKFNAIKQIQTVCDFFKLYDNAKVGFRLNDSCYKVLREDKTLFSSSMGITKEHISPYDVIRDPDVLDLVEKTYSKILLNNSITENDKNIICDSLHFFRKAKESDSQEEALLNYWISLERIFLDFDSFPSKFERTCSFVQSILIERFIFQNGWYCYNFIDNLLKTKTWHKSEYVSEIFFPRELQIKANIGEFLTYPITIELLKFIDSIPEIITHSKNLVANNQMQNVYNFYYDHKTAEKEIINKKEEVRNELLMIYRQRNQIVHNARYDKTLIEYNIAQIKSIDIMVLADLLNGLVQGTTLKDVIMDYYIQYERDVYLALKDNDYKFIEKLKKEDDEI